MSLAGQCYYTACRTRLGHALARRILRTVRHTGAWNRFHPPLDALRLNHQAVSGLMNLWRRIHWSSGDGMMPPAQLLAMYELAVSGDVVGDVVELGAWVGLTTSYLAAACDVRGGGTVYAVDTFQGTREGGTTYASIGHHGGSTLPTFERQILRAGVGHRVKPLMGLTTEMAKIYPGRPVRLLIIDADHSFEGVKTDFDVWWPHVAPGGVIVFHDYLMPDVARFVDTVLADAPRVVTRPGLIEKNIYAVTKCGRGRGEQSRLTTS